MMPIALQYDIGIDEFEKRTFFEINMMIEVKQEARDRQMKSSLLQEYQMVDLMAASLGRLMDKDVKYPKIYEIYPKIFGEELREAHEKEELRRQNQIITAQWQSYAVQYNSSIKEDKMEVKE